MDDNLAKPNKIWIVLAFLAIYIIWGATYLFVAFAVEEIPPFLMVGVRFTAAGTIIFTIVALSGTWKPVSKLECRNAFIAGSLFLTIGNGGVTWALQYIDSGITALLISGQPLIMILMMWLYFKKPLPLQAWLGVALGIAGMYLLVGQDSMITSSEEALGILIILCCLVGWAIASLFTNQAKMPSSYFINAGIQMLVGGISLLIVSAVAEPWNVDVYKLSSRTWLSLFILIIFGSIIAFTSFNFLLKHVSPEKVTSSTYINPIVALTLGYFFRDELITQKSLIACAVLLTGVYFINSNKHKLK